MVYQVTPGKAVLFIALHFYIVTANIHIEELDGSVYHEQQTEMLATR